MQLCSHSAYSAQQFERSLALPFLGIGMKTDFFPVLWSLNICKVV